MEMDLQEQTRMLDAYDKLQTITDLISDLSVFPSLVWVWTWDVVKDKLDYYSEESGEYLVINPEFDTSDVFRMFWTDADKNGFTLEYGTEDLNEHVFDWMVEKNILINVEETNADD